MRREIKFVVSPAGFVQARVSFEIRVRKSVERQGAAFGLAPCFPFSLRIAAAGDLDAFLLRAGAGEGEANLRISAEPEALEGRRTFCPIPKRPGSDAARREAKAQSGDALVPKFGQLLERREAS